MDENEFLQIFVTKGLDRWFGTRPQGVHPDHASAFTETMADIKAIMTKLSAFIEPTNIKTSEISWKKKATCINKLLNKKY